MPSNSDLGTSEVIALRRSLTRSVRPERSTLLSAALGRSIRSPKALREWHDLLLFLLAHPHDGAEYELVKAELQRVATIAEQMVRRSERLRSALINSGLEGLPLQSTYTLRLTRWMVARWKDRVELFSVEAELDEFRELLRLLLMPAEMETVDQPHDDVYQLLGSAFGPERTLQLQRIIEALYALRADEPTRELLWARMQVYVKVEGAAGCGMTFSRSPNGEVFHHPKGLQRGVDVTSTVNEPAGQAVKLSRAAQLELIDTARTVLATLHRETDPVTDAGAVELFDMGRGLRIALFHLDVAHRLPFDSYVGFMAFKNGVPLAYGGAWIFPGRSKVGINVFPALRGGESAWFFAQLLRLYRQRFGVDRFEAENYQLGHNNPDGLKSGAYWFYYRLGFRPTTKVLQRKADREFRKLGAKPGHQVPMKLLKELVENGSELVIADNEMPVIDTAELTMAVQRYVVEHYKADRIVAMRQALEYVGRTLPLGDLLQWTPEERSALYLWAIPLDLILSTAPWSLKDRQRMVMMIRTKGAATETRHQHVLKNAHAFLGALDSVLHKE